MLVTLLGVGFVHGLWTGRWDSGLASGEMLELEKVPLVVGAWEGKAIQEDAARDVLPDPENFLFRRYVNHSNGNVASIMLTRGRPGPMVIKHLPTECYVSSGYEMVG